MKPFICPDCKGMKMLPINLARTYYECPICTYILPKTTIKKIQHNPKSLISLLLQQLGTELHQYYTNKMAKLNRKIKSLEKKLK